ncbi:MAG: hypothetical protein QOE70_1163 [Chthoniobacter sp.]|nr:hypothetical protein [Chthoniobacter sp.]
MVDREPGVAAEPAGFAGSVHEGDTDGGVGERVGELGDFRFSFFGHFDPRVFEGSQIEVAGLDFVEFLGIDLREASHQSEQEQRAEAGVNSR